MIKTKEGHVQTQRYCSPPGTTFRASGKALKGFQSFSLQSRYICVTISSNLEGSGSPTDSTWNHLSRKTLEGIQGKPESCWNPVRPAGQPDFLPSTVLHMRQFAWQGLQNAYTFLADVWLPSFFRSNRKKTHHPASTFSKTLGRPIKILKLLWIAETLHPLIVDRSLPPLFTRFFNEFQLVLPDFVHQVYSMLPLRRVCQHDLKTHLRISKCAAPIVVVLHGEQMDWWMDRFIKLWPKANRKASNVSRGVCVYIYIYVRISLYINVPQSMVKYHQISTARKTQRSCNIFQSFK